MPSYTFTRTLDADLATAEERATNALAEEGFGIMTEIDVQATMKKKLDLDVAAYKILGACNPHFAHQALTAEPHIGVMLPCNVILRDVGEGQTEVSAIDPIASMSAVENDALAGIAGEVRARLQRVVESM